MAAPSRFPAWPPTSYLILPLPHLQLTDHRLSGGAAAYQFVDYEPGQFQGAGMQGLGRLLAAKGGQGASSPKRDMVEHLYLGSSPSTSFLLLLDLRYRTPCHLRLQVPHGPKGSLWSPGPKQTGSPLKPSLDMDPFVLGMLEISCQSYEVKGMITTACKCLVLCISQRRRGHGRSGEAGLYLLYHRWGRGRQPDVGPAP